MALNPNPVNWFEIPVNDLSRATKFYESIFDVELQLNEIGPSKMAFFPMTKEGSAGSGGTLLKQEGYNPSSDGTLVYFSVDDIEAVLNKVNKNGGKTIEEKTGIGEHGFIGIFKDSEGNRVGLHSMK